MVEEAASMSEVLVSKSSQEQTAVVMEQSAESQDGASGAGGCDCASLDQLNIETPRIPGDVALSGVLLQAAVSQLAGKYGSWLWIGEDGHEAYHEGLLKARQGLETRSIHWAKPTPDDRKVAAIMEAMDGMPRPMMIQCVSGARASAALALWLVKKRGYSAASLVQLAQDNDLKAFTKCSVCRPMTEWLMAQMPKKDEAGKLSLGTSGGLTSFQLFDVPTSTFTYLLACEASKKCVLIDPVLEQIDRDLDLVSELGLQLTHVLNTHCHADHVTSGGAIRKRLPHVKTVISKASGAKADFHVAEGDKVCVGPSMVLEVIATPGHTDGCVTYLLREPRMMVFTGDALLIRGCGRTDFQQGDAGMLYDMVRSKIFSLPKGTIVYPGHDYKGRTVSTVGEEAEFNSRLTKSKDEFVEIMKNLDLPYPMRIDVAVPANLVCGVQD